MTKLLSEFVLAVVDKIRSDLDIKVTSYEWEIQDDGDYILISIHSNQTSFLINDPDNYAREISSLGFKKNEINGWMVVLLNDNKVVDSIFSPL